MGEEIKDVVEDIMKDHPFTLTFKNVKWLVISLGVAVSLIYTAGIKTHTFISNWQISDMKMAHQKEIEKVENEKIVLERGKTAALADVDFYRDRYLVSKKRLDACLKEKDFFDIKFEDSEVNK